MDADGNVTGKPGDSVTMSATVASGDLGLMTSTGKVIFYVFSAANGQQVASYTVKTGDAGNSGVTYSASWATSAATADGDYSFRAQAYSASGDPGNTWQRTQAVILSGAPPQVAGITTSPGDGRVTLDWTACTASDFDHYEVWMGTSPGSESDLALSPALTSNTFIKTGLTNDETYYFVVYAVDKDGNKSPASAEVAQTPTSMPGVNSPTMPGNFAAAASFDTAVLTWTASTQDATSTLAGYNIYRDGGATPFASVDAGATTYADKIGWTSTHTYVVRAYNAAGRSSSATGACSVTTGTAPTANLTVTNTNKSSAITVWVQSTTTGLWWTGHVNPSTSTSSKPAGLSIAKKNKTGVWYALPYDTYSVTTGGGLSQTLNPSRDPFHELLEVTR